MKVTSSLFNDVVVLSVSGEFTADGVGRFREAVETACNEGRRDFAVDLAEVTTIDSAALEAFTALQRRCDEQLGLVRFCGADQTLRKIFELTRLDKQLTLMDSTEEALAAVR